MKQAFDRRGYLLVLVLGLFMFLLCQKEVYAEEPNYLGQVIDGSVLTDNVEEDDLQLSRLRNSYLMQGFIKITNNGNGIVGIGGTTDCFVTCDVVKLNLYLERSTGNGDFSSYKSFEYTAYNDHGIAKSLSYVVDKGYYYRLRGYHYASKNGVGENLGSRTDGIYIG